MNQGHYAECKKPISKGSIVYDFIYITFPEQLNCGYGEQINGF